MCFEMFILLICNLEALTPDEYMVGAHCIIVPGNCRRPIVSCCTRQWVNLTSPPSLPLLPSLPHILPFFCRSSLFPHPSSLICSLLSTHSLIEPVPLFSLLLPLTHTRRPLWTDSNSYQSETFFAQSPNNVNKESAASTRTCLRQLPQQPQPPPPRSQTPSTSITRQTLPAERMSFLGATFCWRFQKPSIFATGRLSFLL